MDDIVKELSDGTPLQYAVIVPEGLSSVQIIKLLAEREWKATGGAAHAYKLAGEPPAVTWPKACCCRATMPCRAGTRSPS